MCGIYGYIWTELACPIILKGQRMLESRLWIPKSYELLAPIVYIIHLYLLTYHLAIKNKINPDIPRHLAKTLSL